MRAARKDSDSPDAATERERDSKKRKRNKRENRETLAPLKIHFKQFRISKLITNLLCIEQFTGFYL